MSALILPSNKYNITSYQNSTNNNNSNKNSSGDNDDDSNGNNKTDNYTKMTRIQDEPGTLVNHKTMEYSGYCQNTPWLFVVDILI